MTKREQRFLRLRHALQGLKKNPRNKVYLTTELLSLLELQCTISLGTREAHATLHLLKHQFRRFKFLDAQAIGRALRAPKEAPRFITLEQVMESRDAVNRYNDFHTVTTETGRPRKWQPNCEFVEKETHGALVTARITAAVSK